MRSAPKPRLTQAATNYAHHLADLKRRAPFERMLIEHGYSFYAPNIFHTDTQYMYPFFLHTIDDGVRLQMPTFGVISNVDAATAKSFVRLTSKKATVTRFSVSRYGIIQAEALFHGRFNRTRFSNFLVYWRSDIEPIHMVKELTLEQWHRKNMGRMGGKS